MLRRVVSLLLLPCVLLTQSAVVLGHAHAGQRLPGHDLRPHVHTQAASHDHGHRHLHGHGHSHGTGAHHYHDDEDAPQPRMPVAPSPEPLSHHDSDALYFVGVDVVAGGRSVVGPDLDTSSLWVALAPGGFARSCRDSSPQPPYCWHPPPKSSCPLYVRLLALLI